MFGMALKTIDLGGYPLCTRVTEGGTRALGGGCPAAALEAALASALSIFHLTSSVQ